MIVLQMYVSAVRSMAAAPVNAAYMPSQPPYVPKVDVMADHEKGNLTIKWQHPATRGVPVTCYLVEV